MALGTFTLTGSWKKSDASNATGRIRIVPTVVVVDGVTNDVIVPRVPIEVTLASGAISQSLSLISEVDSNYTYTITEILDDQAESRSYTIDLSGVSASTTVDISDLVLAETPTPPETPTVNTVSATGSAETLAFSRVHDVTMDEDCTFTFSAAPDSGQAGSMTIILRGAFTPTWPASVDWPSGTTPTHATPSVYEFLTVDGGTTVLGFQAGSALS